MEEAIHFITRFLQKEAECWTKLELSDLADYNNSVGELYGMASDSMEEAFGILEENELDTEDDPQIYNPAFLFKISEYDNKDHGQLWAAYTSYKNPCDVIEKTSISRTFVITNIHGELRIIGMLSVHLRESDMKPVSWRQSAYNSEDLQFRNLGKFVSSERIRTPADDDFSLKDYLEDK